MVTSSRLRQLNVPSFIFLSLVIAGVVAVSFVLTLSLWMAREANSQAGAHVQNLVNSALTGVSQRVSTINLDYAYWEEAYFAVLNEEDTTVDSYIGTAVEETGVLSIAQVVNGAGAPVYGYTEGLDENQGRVIPLRLIRAFADILRARPIEPEITVTGHAYIGGQFFILSASHMFPYDDNILAMPEGFPPMFISGENFSTERLTEISAEYLVEDLRLIDTASAAPEGYSAETLFGINGAPVAKLIWKKPRPGDALMATALPAIGVMSMFLLMSLVLVARKSSGMAHTIVEEREHAQTSARTDALTGLTNRTGLMEIVRDPEIENAARKGNLVLVYADLNDFKAINDQLGHDAGDKALIVMAERLRASSRHHDHVARLGGDEFVVLLTGPSPEAAATGFGKRLLAQIANPVQFDEEVRFVKLSIGVALAEPGDCWEDLMVRADVAMYHAKKNKKTEMVYFSEDLRETDNWERSVEERLRRGLKAVAKGQSPFRLEFQPIVEGRSGTMLYAEALLRWTDESLGPVEPGAFIPIAEAKGLLPELGTVVLEESCQVLHNTPELSVSVNISPLQLIEDNFTSRVLEITQRAKIDPSRMILEITENALIEVPETARARIDALREHGFRFALDDFGTGYASVSYLKHFPFDTLKIDRTYIVDIHQCTRARALFSTFVQLGQTLGMDVVAEGVENEAQAGHAIEAGCILHQGFLYARPMGIEQLVDFMSSGQPTPSLSLPKAG